MATPPVDSAKRVELLTARCRDKGLKLTHQRLEIYRVLAADNSHPSADEIHTRLLPKMPTLSLDTVYRTLLTFERHGLINRVEVLDDRARFDANLRTHHHLVCTRCRTAVDLYWPAVDELEAPADSATWGTVESRHLELRGICKNCRDKG